MTRIPFSELNIRPQSRKRIIKRVSRDNFGVDTETYQGRVKLICDSYKKNNYRWIDNADDLLSFLTKFSNRRKFGWFWNIRYDFESIVKWLPIDNIMELDEDGKTTYDRFHIEYLEGKYFEISERKNKARFYDMTNFLTMSLDTAASRYLGEHKLEGIDGNKLNTDEKYWEEYKDKILEYCLRDADLTRRLADWFWELVNTTLNMKPWQPFSCGAYSQDYFLHKCVVPRIEDIPREVLEYAYNSYYGGRFELLQRGHFDKMYIYDLKSAYPAIISGLVDYTYGTWHHTDEFNWDYPNGFYKCSVWPQESVMSPIMFKDMGLNCYCNGNFDVFLTSWEIRFIKKNMSKSPLVIHDGYYWEPDAALLHPFKKEIERLYTWKEMEKDDDVKFVVKLFLNALSGKFFQTVGGHTGRLFNPLYAAECTSRTRIKLLEAAMLCGPENIISFSTDAIHTTKPFTPWVTREDSLGDFVLDFEGEGVYILSDVYSAWNEERKKDRFRGMFIDITDENDRVHTMRAHDMLQRMKESTVFRYIVKRPVHLKEALSQRQKKGIEAINRFHEVEREVHINGDMKRTWPRNFISAEEALNSHQSSTPRTILSEVFT